MFMFVEMVNPQAPALEDFFLKEPNSDKPNKNATKAQRPEGISLGKINLSVVAKMSDDKMHKYLF